MSRIREDFVGTVQVRVNGVVVRLAAGDEVPAGAKLGGHLVAAPRKRRTKKSQDSE